MSPISSTTVVHHETDGGEHWTVLIGTTVIAYCTTPHQAAHLADAMNDAKRAGDSYEPTTLPAPSIAVAPHAPCRPGLRISPKIAALPLLIGRTATSQSE